MNRVALTLVLAMICLGRVHAEQPQPLVLVKTIPLEGVEGRLDHLAVDSGKNLLYVSAVTNDSVEVVNTQEGKHDRTVSGPRGPQGLAVIPETHELVVTSGEDGVCRLYDETLTLVRFLSELEDADAVRYDEATKHVYVATARGLTIIDPKGPTKVAQTSLDTEPESFQVEKEGNNIYVNLPAPRQIAVVNKNTLEITARWDLLEARDNFPMALDEKNHRLFIGCRRPSKVLVYDTERGSYIGKVDCVADADDMFYDAERKCVYVSGGQGYVTVIKEVDPYLYQALGTVPTSPGARTSQFDPSTGHLYVAVPHRRKQPAEVWVFKPRS